MVYDDRVQTKLFLTTTKKSFFLIFVPRSQASVEVLWYSYSLAHVTTQTYVHPEVNCIFYAPIEKMLLNVSKLQNLNIFPSSSKYSKKTLDLYCFVTSL
jgi:hypothetical protein